MANDTITLSMDGLVPLRAFGQTMQRLYSLIVALDQEYAPGARIQWFVEDLRSGSAVATIRGEAKSIDPVLDVIRAYDEIGRSLQRHERPAASPKVVARAQAIPRVLNGKVTAIHFLTAYEESVIQREAIHQELYPVTIGSVDGTVEALNSHLELRFVLYDDIFKQAVTCYVEDEHRAQLLDIWGRRVRVEGTITRHPVTGRPTSVRHIRSIHRLDQEPGDVYAAKGAWLRGPDDLSALDAIRRVRRGE